MKNKITCISIDADYHTLPFVHVFRPPEHPRSHVCSDGVRHNNTHYTHISLASVRRAQAAQLKILEQRK